MKLTKGLTMVLWVGFIIMLPLSTHAEEGASGHYTPGGAASFIDTLPGKPGLALANFFNYYDGSSSVSKRVPVGGLTTASLDATAYSDTVVALYQTPLKLLGGYYAIGVAIPFVWMEAKGEVQVTWPGGSITQTKRDKASGIGDVLFYPFMLGCTGLKGDLKSDVRLGVYAPPVTMIRAS